MIIIVRWVLADGSFSAAGGISIRLWTNCSRPAVRARALTPRVKRTCGCPTLIPNTTVLMHGRALSTTPLTMWSGLGQWIEGTRSIPKTRIMALGSKFVRPSRMTQYIGKSRPICSSDGRHPAVGLTPRSL